MPIFVLCLCLACLGMGCLGLGGHSDTGGTIINPVSKLSISGRAYFADRQLYGNIPIVVKNFQKETVAVTTTDSGGYYSFSNIAPGIYYVSATTGESEVTFANMIQVTDQGCTEINPASLLCITDVVVDQISSGSFHIDFHTNRSCRASLEYGPTGGYLRTKTIGQAGQTHHEATIGGLNFLTDYEISIHITGDDGQEFVMNGLNANTTGTTGCDNQAININNGDYETSNRSVTVYLNADNCSQMRFSENYAMDDANWLSYSPTYSHTFSNSSAGIKRLYVQFKSKEGIVSPIQSDSIIFTSAGYIGIWINNGDAVTCSPAVNISAIYPGATQMIISEDNSFSGAFWEPYYATRNWNFTGADGIKNIYCKFKGGTANPEEIFKASIIYDTTPPTVEMIVNNGSSVTASTSVRIVFSYSSAPSHMKIVNGSAPDPALEWSPFKNTVNWTIPSGDGQKVIYSLFKDSAGNEFGPLSAAITLDTVAPTGNTISVLESDSSTSAIATFSLIDDLPKYLHFNVTDTSTYKVHYYVGPATTTPPTEYLELFSPFSPVELGTNNLVLGGNKMWAYFSDEAGNDGFLQNTTLRVEGPEIEISPSSIRLITEQEQQFTTTLKNIDAENVGDILWSVASGSGYIDSETGIFTAPAFITSEQTTTVRATSKLRSTLYGEATVILIPSVEIAYLYTDSEGNIQRTKTPINSQIKPGETINFDIYVYNSQKGVTMTSTPLIGEVSTSTVEKEYGSQTTFTYKAPATIIGDSATINIEFCVEGSSSITGNIPCIISNGANLNLTPSSDKAQRKMPLTVTASVTNDSTPKVIKWTISPSDAGSFSETDGSMNETTTGPVTAHSVKFYAGSPTKITSASITAEIVGSVPLVKTQTNFKVYPPMKLTIEPQEATAMPLIEPITFNVNNIEYLIDGTSEELRWEFKNSSGYDYVEANGKLYADKGKLTKISNTQVQYERPEKLPSSIGESDVILIRATSVADETASFTAMVTLAQDVKVTIYKDISKTQPITTAATVIEVGTLQFYAKIEPDNLSNNSVTWTVNGVTSSDQYGSIDSNGKYIAPSITDSTKVTVRATSNYDTSKYKEVEVTLSDFWEPKMENMVDSDTSEPIAISCLFVDPIQDNEGNFVVYAGTGAENKFGYYGLYWAKFSSISGDTSFKTNNWQPLDAQISSMNFKRSSNDSYLIYAITMTRAQNIYVSTAGGVYCIQIDPSTRIPHNCRPLECVGGYPRPNSLDEHYPSEPMLAIDSAETEEGTKLLVGGNTGVYSLLLDTPYQIKKVDYLINTRSRYHVRETRQVEIQLSPETPTASATYETRDITYWSCNATANPIEAKVLSIKYDNLNKSLYFGTDSGNVYYLPSLVPNMYKITNVRQWSEPSGSESHNVYLPSFLWIYGDKLEYPSYGSVNATPMAIALDVINTNTLWTATTNGVYRSTNYGMTWAQHSFGGVDTNSKAIIVDPNNTINVMAGSEDGLYRTVNGGSNWTRIRSGLGNYKTITALGQAAGAAGEKRKVWVGTSGGVFMGKQSLALE